MAKTYFFHPDKKMMKQGWILEDENQNPVYEAKKLKATLLGPEVFEFVNHITGTSEQHKVGHTVTTETTTGVMDLSFFTVKSRFKFDGVKVWDYLHERGIRIDSAFSSGKIGMTYRLLSNGQEIATVASAAGNGGKFFLTTPFTYHVTTEVENLDLVFLTTFAIARTEQTFYN